MRHGKKKKLTAQDMERALKWYDAPPTFGHQYNPTEQNYVQAPDATRPQETLFAPEESVVDLYDYSLDTLQDEEQADDAGLSCEAAWVAVEGTAIDDHQQELNCSSKVDYPQPSDLSQPLLHYYTALVGVILSDSNHDIRKTMLEDVQSNSKIGPIIPFLVTFIGNGMQRHNDNPILIARLLTLLEAIFINPHLNLSPKPYVNCIYYFYYIYIDNYSSFIR